MTAGTGASGARCAREGCPHEVRVVGAWRPAKRFCSVECRTLEITARGKARRLAAKATVAPIQCARRGCGKSFTPSRAGVLFCSQRCNHRSHIGVHDTARRRAGEQEARRRARAERCPQCGAALGSTWALLYCAARCGWDLLLTARERDPRADCDKPDDDGGDDV